MINPTGGAIRNDVGGNGHYGASRGARKHQGTDYLVLPGAGVVAPITGRISRVVRVYPDSDKWVGVEIVGLRVTVKLFYVVLFEPLLHTTVEAGDILGLAQNISKRYQTSMKPHIHMEITHIDPQCFVGV